MDNNSSSLKIAFMYIAIFLLVILIAIPPIFRIAFGDNDKTADTSNVKNNISTTVLHCTKEETIGTLTYNVQTFSTYSDKSIEKVIIRYKRTGELDSTNQNNNYEQEIANLKANSNITETESDNGGKFEILKDALTTKTSDQIVGLYAKNIDEEQAFLASNNYVCEINKN